MSKRGTIDKHDKKWDKAKIRYQHFLLGTYTDVLPRRSHENGTLEFAIVVLPKARSIRKLGPLGLFGGNGIVLLNAGSGCWCVGAAERPNRGACCCCC